MTQHSALHTLATACFIGATLLAAAADASADDRRFRGFFGGAPIASVHPERFATRTNLSGAPEETRPGALVFGGVTLTRRLAVQGEISLTGRWRDDEERDRDHDSRRRVEWSDGLVSGVVRWRVASIGNVSLEPVGGVTMAFARDRRGRNRDRHDDDRPRTDFETTRGGVVAGADVSVAVVRGLSVVPTFRVHRLAREQRDRDDTPDLKDGRNVYRFGIGARWLF